MVNDNVWRKYTTSKSLIVMFAKQGKEMIILETVMGFGSATPTFLDGVHTVRSITAGYC